MKGKHIIVGLLLVFVLLLGGAYALYTTLGSQVETEHLATQEPSESSAQSGEEEQKVAALDFAVEDGTGNQVHLSDYLGKPLVLNFWASWCGPCKNEMPDFDEVYQQRKDEVTFFMVNVTDGSQETLESAQAYVKEQGFSLPIFYDTQMEASIAYSVSGLPTTFFIDAEGYIVAWANGMISRETLEKGIQMACGEN